LAVDHGEKRLGLALSDETQTLAAPLTILQHIARIHDAARVAEIARERGAGLIIVGQSFDEEGRPNTAGRRAARFADSLRSQTAVPVILWDESLSTQDARAIRLEAGSPRRRRSGHLDDVAAAVLLQSYLDAHSHSDSPVEGGGDQEAGTG
jgi:putative Holliday junction resolvase